MSRQLVKTGWWVMIGSGALLLLLNLSNLDTTASKLSLLVWQFVIGVAAWQLRKIIRQEKVTTASGHDPRD
jgi:hypothetical protein